MLFSSVMAFLAAPFMLAQKEQEVSKPRHVVDGLIEWLEMKEPAGPYEWLAWDEPCLLKQYGIAAGFPSAYHYMGVLRAFNHRNNAGVLIEPGDIAYGRPRTYGAALKRARAYKRKYNL